MRQFWNLLHEVLLTCYSFPYYEDDPDKYVKLLSSYWEFHLQGGGGPHGLIPQAIVEKMPWDEAWHLEHLGKKKITVAETGQQERVIRNTLERARQKDSFAVLRGWRNELYPIYGHNDVVEETISMERAASPLFGINTYGVHMTAHVNTLDGLKIWVPRRARTKQTYGGMLDNTVAGGLSTGEQPLECVIREAAEEASFPEQLVRSKAKACGTVSYVHIRDARAGGETGLIQPECQYIYDIEIDADVVPQPGDNEVEAFYLWTVHEVKKALADGQFKPNCAVVLLDFFIRHGILTAENEPDYLEIASRIHRKLPFPTS